MERRRPSMGLTAVWKLMRAAGGVGSRGFEARGRMGEANEAEASFVLCPRTRYSAACRSGLLAGLA